jgi:hypothetical protein
MNTYIKKDLSDILSLKMKISQIPVVIAELGATELIPVIYKAINLLTIQKGEFARNEQSVGQGAWIF